MDVKGGNTLRTEHSEGRAHERLKGGGYEA